MVFNIRACITYKILTVCTLGRFDEAPYGYELIDGELYIATNVSNLIVQRIFKEYIDSRSFDAIARALSNENMNMPYYCYQCEPPRSPKMRLY